MARTNRQIDARERARSARLRLDAERDKRDRLIEEAAAKYYTAGDERDELATKLQALDERMDATVQDLLNLGETPSRVAVLLGIEAREVRRIRRDAEREQRTPHSTSSHKEPEEDSPLVHSHPQGQKGSTAVHTAPNALGSADEDSST
ncbi:hypothetical protein KZX45_08335 [Georgenia sp. EYE_87]|uniref:hypothetical protein n=1 Tax=Georgenia sp. EYE_87 TaxID=2853448 RepID=UPI002002DE23|nr:hypothetical protein [Georgenia sp. EYE_87]MCK6210549.1 hypothetical protein [Georgenia sp. EYE_87]